MKYLMPAIRFKIFMTLLLGLLYPFVMTGISQAVFPRQSSGDFITRGGQRIGSQLIAQKFETLKYFWPRPSAVDYNALSSGGSNLGPTSQDLKKVVDERKAQLKLAHADQLGDPPQDLIFASASGLDPHISPEAAEYQVSRVAKARGLSVQQIHPLLEQASESRQWGIFGEPVVNVLALNRALDKSQGIESAPTLAPTPSPNSGTPATTSPNDVK